MYALKSAVLVFWLGSAVSYAQIPCPCDPKQPETLKERQCSLCAAVEKQPPNVMVVFTQDASPRKPDRWLALPRSHSPGMHQMGALSAEERTELWRSAIAKAKELWGENWGLAYNAEVLHTQCHVHVHIGKLIEGVEWGEFKVVNGPEEIPLPGPNGLWIHPVDGKLHVHIGENVTENVLLR
jgi:hypothetical protein